MMQLYRLKHIMILVLTLFVLSCSESQKALEIRCMPVLQKILNIQDKREVIRKDFSISTKAYRENNVNKNLWLKEKQAWLERESKLALQANDLYIYSYKTGCLK